MQLKSEIYSLTGLRFIAALYVFLFHMEIRWPVSSNIYMSNVIKQGAIGMSLFFILSGFLLAYTYTDRRYQIREYFFNRFARIYPVYFLSAVLSIPFISGAGSEPLNGVVKIALLIISNIFLIQAWFVQFFPLWNDGGSWSISAELFFYVLFPYLLLLFRGLYLKNIIITLVFFYILCALPGIIINYYPSNNDIIYYSVPIYRLSEFIFGILLYKISKIAGSKFAINDLTLLIFILILVGYLAYFGPNFNLYIGHNFIVIPLLGIIVYSLSSHSGYISRILSGKVLVFLGKISYCFYSFQVIALLLLIDKHDILIRNYPLLNNNFLLLSITFVLLIVLSSIGYLSIEVPARNFLKQKYLKLL